MEHEKSHSTHKNESHHLGVDLGKWIPNIVVTIFIAFSANYIAGLVTQGKTEIRLATLEQQMKDSTANAAAQAIISQQNAIKLAELSVAQGHILSELKDIKQDQQRMQR